MLLIRRICFTTKTINFLLYICDRFLYPPVLDDWLNKSSLTHLHLEILLNTFEASWTFFCSLFGQKELQLAKTLLTSRVLDSVDWLSLFMVKCNCSFWCLDMHKRQHFKAWEFKSFNAPSTFTFWFLSSMLLLLYS